MIYLTYGNQSAGVYSSYVTDVCHYWKEEFDVNVKIIAFVSIRNFIKTRKERKNLYRNSIILPQLPKQQLWWLNILTLVILWPFFGSRKVIALSPIAGNFAKWLKKLGLINTYIYDSEGATAAEWNEYNVVSSNYLKSKAYSLEKNALMGAYKIRTVSLKMVEYWKNQLNFTPQNFVVIPCKLNQIFVSKLPTEQELIIQRKKLGYNDNDIIFCYAGSSAGWQSLDLLSSYFEVLLSENISFKFLFLTDALPNSISLYNKYPQRVNVIHVAYNEVQKYMQLCDYGTLIRESSITNMVAAPTKYAEYLACGLKVIISNQVGDYSEFTKKMNAGLIINESFSISSGELLKPNYEEKVRMNELAKKYFTKENFKKEYQVLLS
ncbi:glycosyltransferase involved in cell wall biosynthesis [Breznakibacter xylanolyticus]|uniref:Glycosyltransferase involved in cell wall biosynthesis n=1 Tax=Breznakibacter xylanolyticus TaxID=990 RepID=A0A2W7MUW8_9BACT|nr:hypothetical protein [Breznakibacter xylanolyticus]PZX11935.1 glycosyltransferase involved in cell wall biosynthesis [Breznakibacter xylanolyticus]